MPVALPGTGGLIILLDAAGLRVDGVTYTATAAALPGSLKF
jgi:hypothetical protein